MKPKYGDAFTIQVTEKRIRSAFGSDIVYRLNAELGGLITIVLGNGQNLHIAVQSADEYDPKIFIHLT